VSPLNYFLLVSCSSSHQIVATPPVVTGVTANSRVTDHSHGKPGKVREFQRGQGK